MNDMPPNVIGIHAIGVVTTRDCEQVLAPRLEELASKQGEINYLLSLETDVTKFPLCNWWDDLNLALTQFTKWNKIAVVTDKKGIEWFTEVFQCLTSGQGGVFTIDEWGIAMEWISEMKIEF
jgi:hypothetical protein